MEATRQRGSLDRVLGELIEEALAKTTDVVSLAVGSRDGLPIVDATRGVASVMTLTAMATMSLASAKTATRTLGMPAPEHLVVHTPGGDLVIMELAVGQCLIALLGPGANVGLDLLVLRDLGGRISDALGT